LINGFARPLPSLTLVRAAIDVQQKAIASGKAVDTGISANNFAKLKKRGNGLNSIDTGNYLTAAPQPLTKRQLRQLVNLQNPAKPQFANPGARGISASGSSTF
jgi:hypothetical protein